MEIAYLNGDWLAPDAAKISIFDRGFMFGDAVYEVLPVYQGRIFTEVPHLERLARSLAEVRIAPPLTMAEWSALLGEAVDRSQEAAALIYIQVSRGVSMPRSHVYGDGAPTVLVTVTPFQGPTIETAPQLRVKTAEDFRWLRADIKVTSLIANGMIKNQAIAEGYDDAIMIRDGKVTEGTSSNVFIVKDEVIKTPPKSERLLHGITRDEMIETARDSGYRVTESAFGLEEMLAADEVWLSATGLELAPVVGINGEPIGRGEQGPVWREVFEAYQTRKRVIE